MKVYILSMLRNGTREEHSYNSGLYSCLADACIEGIEHENCRAGKYEMRIELGTVDDDRCILKEIPREVAVNYAVLKYPNRFDDRKNLKEAVTTTKAEVKV